MLKELKANLFSMSKKIENLNSFILNFFILKKFGSLSNPIKITSYRETFTFESYQTFKIPLNSYGNSHRIFFMYNVIAFVGKSKKSIK